MTHDEPGHFDDSIQLEPVETLAERASRRSAWGRAVMFLVVGGGVLLAIAALAATVEMIARIGQFGAKEVVVTAQREPASLRAESAAVFGNYDAAEHAEAALSDEQRQEREAIAALFDQIERCAAEAKHDEYKKLVDFDRLLKRMELTGNMAGWTYFDKRSWRGQARAMAEAEPYWAEITVASIVTPHDDPNTRIVYAYSNDSLSQDPTENRFWIARDGDTWKLYDWSRLDLGMAESQEWGLYAKHAESSALSGFERWGDLIRESDESINAGDRDAAKEKLRQAEAQSVPSDLQDFCTVLTGYRWAAMDELEEAERCYKRVSKAADTPGAYYGLLTCMQWKQPAEALQYAELYETVVGPSPDLLEVKAELLARLGRDEEAAAEWKRLLRIKPDHTNALSEFIGSLPIDDPSAFEAQLEQLHDSVAAVVGIAPILGNRDYERLLRIAAYINRKAPDSAGSLYVGGLAKQLDGQYEEAANLFRQAYESETDEAKRQSYANDYVSAMAAEGTVVAALKQMPNAKSLFESLYYSYDEGESELTEEDYRQVVALHRELYPDDVNGMTRDVDLAILDERYEDAERVARRALKYLKTQNGDAGDNSDEDSQADEVDNSEYYRDSLTTSLATALYKLNRWKEAYENVGERKERFAQLARLGVEDERWDVVRELLAMHKSADADDPQIHSVEGELAAQEKRWDDAVRFMRQGLAGAEDYSAWQQEQRLFDVYFDSGRWLDYLKSSDDQGETFERLSRRFVSDRDWASLEKLIAGYRQIAPNDTRIVQQEAELAWHQEQYTRYVSLAQGLLQSDDDSIADYEREGIENQLFSAQLRSRQFGQARQTALKEQREQNDVATLAIVNAASGGLAEAQRLALETARSDESAAAFYTNVNVGRVFLDDEFSDLHEEFPVNLPYEATDTLAVFVFAEPQRLEADEIAAAMMELGIQNGAALKPIDSTHEGAISAFSHSLDGASVWLAAGEGKFDDGWQLNEKGHPLAKSLESGRGWLAVGTASLMTADREKAEEAARRLGAALAAGRAIAVRLKGPEMWETTLYPGKSELIAEWKDSRNVRSFEDEGVQLTVDLSDGVAANRKFERPLRAALRAFEASPNSRLEVVAYVSENPRIDPLRLEVKKVRRTYGYLEFDGVLVNDSALVPELRTGLPMQFNSSRIQAVRLDDEDPVRRE